MLSQVIKDSPGLRSFWFYSNGTTNVLNDSAKSHLTSSITTVMIPVISSIILIIGLPANGLALLVLATKVQRMPSTIFLMNLATADLLLILVLPFKIHYHFQGNNWLFGEALCRMITAFFYGNMYCSILLLTFISIDRYFALVHPFYSKGFRDNRLAVGACFMIWAFVGLIMIPFLLRKQVHSFQDPDITTCHDALPEELDSDYFFYYFVCLIAVGFLIPCLITIFCYVSIIRALLISDEPFGQAIRNMVLVLVVYVVCFAPSNIILLIHHSGLHFIDTNHLYLYYMTCLMLSTLNNCIDPFIYYYVSDEFRNKVRSAVFSMKMKNDNSRKTTQPLVQSSSSSAADSKTSSI
ncbi:proteinase-activated receptor 3-like isoform X2 [Pristis pectinata]|uniref:proteinase-activated receptor 3-like isoform X2 n=1 Tax=Pristis pectinata TaxID=685728 RepID=UPI00223E1118|nr:proteinase-activated receptor 3-like isoform X2 [Pristis pectinata]